MQRFGPRQGLIKLDNILPPTTKPDDYKFLAPGRFLCKSFDRRFDACVFLSLFFTQRFTFHRKENVAQEKVTSAHRARVRARKVHLHCKPARSIRRSINYPNLCLRSRAFWLLSESRFAPSVLNMPIFFFSSALHLPMFLICLFADQEPVPGLRFGFDLHTGPRFGRSGRELIKTAPTTLFNLHLANCRGDL